jgi:hypothetical protein
LPKGNKETRLFFTLDSDTTQYSEIDIKKLALMDGDTIVVTSEESLAYMQGKILIDNLQHVSVKLVTKTAKIIKPVSAIVFYEKTPESISIDRDVGAGKVAVTIVY